jgi:hypothetical protein
VKNLPAVVAAVAAAAFLGCCGAVVSQWQAPGLVQGIADLVSGFIAGQVGLAIVGWDGWGRFGG